MQHDGSLHMASWVSHLVSAPEGQDLTMDNGYCINAGANGSVKSHSVPLNESSSGLLAVEGMICFVNNHHQTLFQHQPSKFLIDICSDSECHLYNLDPSKVHKSVLIKNIMRGTHNLIRDLTLRFPFIQVTFSYVESSQNVADINSKVHLDPVSLINSNMWRFGNKDFLNVSWPAKNDIYLTVTDGIPHWTPPKRATTSCQKCKNTFCSPHLISYVLALFV